MSESMVGKWTHVPGWVFGPDEQSYQRAMAFLSGHGLIEDWGCGTAHAKKYAGENPYRGIDGSEGGADEIVDLVAYRSDVPCILLRHVLEHNEEWKTLLENAVASFSRHLALVIYTPLVDTTHLHLWSDASCMGQSVPEFWFNDADLLAPLRHLLVDVRPITSGTPYGGERLFFVKRRDSHPSRLWVP